MLDHVLQQLAHRLEQQHRDLVLERLGDAVVLHASPCSRCCWRTRSASQRSASTRPFSCSPGGASSSISVRVCSVVSASTCSISAMRSSCSRSVSLRLIAASVRLMPVRFCAGPSCSSLASLRRARSSASVISVASARSCASCCASAFSASRIAVTSRPRAPEAQHVAVLDDADHRDQQHAIEPVGPVHHVLDVAHLVAVADRLANALDVDPRPGGMIREPRADHGAGRILDAQRHHEGGVALGDVGMFAHPGDLLVRRQRDRHGLGQLGAENGLGAVGDEGAIALVAGCAPSRWQRRARPSPPAAATPATRTARGKSAAGRCCRRARSRAWSPAPRRPP